ncbi:hypothetical protein ACSSS7_004064 [Eimeria intestinalis]
MQDLYFLVGFLFNSGLVHSDLVLGSSPAAPPKSYNWPTKSFHSTFFEGALSNGLASPLGVRHHSEQAPPTSPILTQLEDSVAVPSATCCEGVVNAFREDFAGNSAVFTRELDHLKQPEPLGARNCLKSTADPHLNPPEISIVKESVDLHFGAIWLWNKIAAYLLKERDVPPISKRFFSGVPPPINPGDTVKLFESGTTILGKKEYLVASVQPDGEVDIKSGGEKLTVPREQLLLTISAKHVAIADRALKNELAGMADDDPSLLADIEEVFKAAGIGEGYEQSQRANDPRFLLAAMKKSETFHSYELLQMIRGHTVLENCKPVTHKNLYGTANELASRMLENAKFEAMNLQNHDVLYAVLENQCRTTAFFVFPQTSDQHRIVVPQCAKAWEEMRSDWSQLGQLAPGYLGECNARCMSSVVKRNIWFDKSRVKRKAVGKDHLMAGDVTRFSTFYSEGDLTYLDLVGGANLQRRAEMRKAARGSMVFSSFFRLLSCRLNDDAEWLHKRFLPFASLAVRIALFLRVEVEEQSSKGWYAAVQVFGVGDFNPKAFRKVASRMEGHAKKFINKFMGGFGKKATGKLEKLKNRIKHLFRGEKKTAARNLTTVHRIGHVFAKLLLFMWTVGGKRQFDSKSSVDRNFYFARLYQALTILNHGENPVKPIIDGIKIACKKTLSSVRHDNWDLLARKKNVIGSFADELGAAAAWGFATGSSFSELYEAGHALAKACKGQGSLDLTEQRTSYRILLEHHQCMKLQSQ